MRKEEENRDRLGNKMYKEEADRHRRRDEVIKSKNGLELFLSH